MTIIAGFHILFAEAYSTFAMLKSLTWKLHNTSSTIPTQASTS